MTKCDKCQGGNIKTISVFKFHDILKCVTCGNWTFKRIQDCCRKPYEIVAQDHKFPMQTRLYKQCLECGGCVNRKKPLSFKTHGEECEAEFDNYRFEDWQKERSQESKQLTKDKNNYNYYDSPYYKYQVYLSSYEWREKRKLVLARDNNLCQECKVKPADDIHHLTYKNLYDEPLEDLQSLCRTCHSTAHGITLPEFISKEHETPDLTLQRQK